MKLPLRLVASFLLASVHASSDWLPYHDVAVGDGQSTGPLHGGPVYGVAPATVGLLPAEPINGAQTTIVAGPVTNTVVEGSSSGTVTIVSPGTPTDIPQATKPAAIKKAVPVPPDAVLVKGPAAGPVTILAPVDDRLAKTKKGAAGRVDGAVESHAITDGIATANAVIGPTTGPIVIAGPTAPPIPPELTAKPEPVGAPTTSDEAGDDDYVAESDEAAIVTNATDSASIESSAPSSATVTSTSAARVNLITPAAAAIPSSEEAAAAAAAVAASLSNVAVSAPAVVSVVPEGTVPGETVSSLLLNSQFHLE